MTNGECIYRKTVDYMSRMAPEKDDFRTFSDRFLLYLVRVRKHESKCSRAKSFHHKLQHLCYHHLPLAQVVR